MNPSDGVVCWTHQFLSLTWWTGPKTGRITNHHRVLWMCRLPNVCNRPRCWQLRRIELWLRPDQQVASAKQDRSGFFPPSNVSSSRKGKGKGKVKGKSKDPSCLICGRSDHFWRQCPERQPKGSGKGGKNGSRTFYLGAAWSFDSELFETVVLQADVVLDCGATETAGGVEAVQILVDAVTQGFPDSRVEVDSLDRPRFRLANGHWGRALSSDSQQKKCLFLPV